MARLILFTISLLLMNGCQGTFIYHPQRATEDELIREARALDMEPWLNDRGDIIGWRNRAQTAGPRLIVFHGNAGYALHRMHYVRALSQLEGKFDVMIMEYPGYGSRAGTPSEKAIMEAANEAVRLLLGENSRPLFLAGESLGSGVATEMAARFPEQISGLLLVTPFTSLKEAAESHFPRFLVRMILSERYDNVRALEGYAGPVGILLAEYDEVVPSTLGQELYETYKGPKKLIVQKGRTHNNLDLSPSASWWQELTSFLQDNVK